MSTLLLDDRLLLRLLLREEPAFDQAARRSRTGLWYNRCVVQWPTKP